jgi:hypothetical protein
VVTVVTVVAVVTVVTVLMTQTLWSIYCRETNES